MRIRSEEFPTGRHRSTGCGGIGLLLLLGLLVAILAAACGGPSGLATSTPFLPASDRDPSVLGKGPDGSTVLAPIESVVIERVAAKPPNASLTVVSGLPSGCESFGGYTLDQEGDVIYLEVTNLRRDLVCPATYTTVTTSILLGQPVYSNIEPCKTYTVVVNGETHLVQASCPAIPSGQFSDATPTPEVVREWILQEVRVDGSTVIVRLHVYAGIDVRATLDGKSPGEINAPVPTLEFVFHRVTPGAHTVEIRDVVGFEETAAVLVPAGEVQVMTLGELFASPDQYNGNEILLEGFYFHGWESNLLSERMEASGFAEGHLWPRGAKVWVEGSIPREVYDRLHQQEMTGPLERYGKVRIKGTFHYGEEYGHLGGFDAQIVPSQAELLPWSPTPEPRSTMGE